jgi:hypothetical protein
MQAFTNKNNMVCKTVPCLHRYNRMIEVRMCVTRRQRNPLLGTDSCLLCIIALRNAVHTTTTEHQHAIECLCVNHPYQYHPMSPPDRWLIARQLQQLYAANITVADHQPPRDVPPLLWCSREWVPAPIAHQLLVKRLRAVNHHQAWRRRKCTPLRERLFRAVRAVATRYCQMRSAWAWPAPRLAVLMT